MLDFLTSIGGLIVSLVQFLATTISSLFVFIGSIPTYLNFINVLLSVLPPFLLPFTVATVSLTIVAMLIRRNIV